MPVPAPVPMPGNNAIPHAGEDGDAIPGDSAPPNSDTCPLDPSGKDPCKGIARQLQIHRQKLEDYMRDPNAADNLRSLATAHPDQQALIYNGRITNLLKQIEAWERALAKCRAENSQEGQLMRTIDIATVKAAVNLLLDHIMENGLGKLPLNEQLYWKVLDNEKYVMNKTPGEPGVGDLFTDLDFVEAVVSDGQQLTALTLTELGPLLTYIGEFAGESLAAKGG